jgi:hypothetical protein
VELVAVALVVERVGAAVQELSQEILANPVVASSPVLQALVLDLSPTRPGIAKMAKELGTTQAVNCCKACRFWQPLPTSPVGSCHRYAPVAEFPTADIRHTDEHLPVTWPRTLPFEWCGDFEKS